MAPPVRRSRRVLLADDAALFREALAGGLTSAGHSVTQVGDAAELLVAATAEPPEIAVIDVRMPPTHTVEGIDAALALRDLLPEVGVVLLSQDVEVAHLSRLVADSRGGVGYLLKQRVGGLAEFLDELERVASGGVAVDPEVVRAMVRRRVRAGNLGGLTDRESDVLALMAEGRSNRNIAEQLHISVKTVESRMTAIFAKLELCDDADDNRRVMAVLAYLGAG